MNQPDERNVFALNEQEIEGFERLAYSRRHEEAGRAIVTLLARLHAVYGVRGYVATPRAEEYLYTRLAGALTVLLADEGFSLQPAGFAALALSQTTIASIMEASAFAGSDHLVRLIGDRDPRNPNTLNFPTVQQQFRLLLAYSLDSETELGLEEMFRHDPALMLPVYLSMLCRYTVLSPNAQRRRTQLLRIGPLFEQTEVRIDHMSALAAAWMNCMYGTEPDRHLVKRSLNAMARRLLGPTAEIEAAAARPRRALAEKPIMLVPLEHFRVEHVNHRTYAAMIRRLRERFTLVGAGSSVDFDDVSVTLFDRMVEVVPPESGDLQPMLRRLAEVRPDIVFYPTLGIQWWWIPMCTARLAPIQAMSMGVPATSHSPAMDYVVVEESWSGEPDCYSETLIHTRVGSTRFQKRDAGRARGARREDRAEEGTTRIAVPSLATKLNATFLETCRRIERQSKVPLDWRFFAGMAGLHHAVTRRHLHRWFPRATVYGYMEYSEFMRELASCDLHLSTFPFGGTNTNLDTMSLGIPMVTLIGRECHSQIDAGMIRRAGLPAWLIARTPDEYAHAALRLIHSPEERAKIGRMLGKARLNDLFAEADPRTSDDFADAFCWLYEHHDALRRDGRKCWTVKDRARFRR